MEPVVTYVCAYLAATAARAALVWVLMQRVQASNLWPSTTVYCKFGSKRFMEERILCERFMVRE